MPPNWRVMSRLLSGDCRYRRRAEPRAPSYARSRKWPWKPGRSEPLHARSQGAADVFHVAAGGFDHGLGGLDLQDLDLGSTPFAVVVLVGGDAYLDAGFDRHLGLTFALAIRYCSVVHDARTLDSHLAQHTVRTFDPNPSGRIVRAADDDAPERTGSSTQQS